MKLRDAADHLVQAGPACLSSSEIAARRQVGATACTAAPGRPAAVPWLLGIALAATCFLTRASQRTLRR